MALIQELDFVGIPSQDAERARSFYRDVLGMRPDEHAQYEQWAGSTCFVVWEPERVGMEFVAQTGNPLPLHVEDVHAARAELESKGVTFFGDTLDTGVCHMAIFADPDGNQLMLHRPLRAVRKRVAGNDDSAREKTLRGVPLRTTVIAHTPRRRLELIFGDA
jgi:catechol 2,3-dioxygenase-like lactoylglutathione lyase family enzyme